MTTAKTSRDPHQSALFNPTKAVAGRNHPATSHKAAASVSPKKIKATHELILHMIGQHGPMTDYDLRDQAEREGFKISWSGMSARRGEMCPPRGRGLRDSGRTKATPNKRAATLWEIDPNVEPEVPPSKIRNLRPSQRAVYDIFVDIAAEGIDSMSHAQLNHEYQSRARQAGLEEVMTDSGVRSRCAELVALKLVERKADSESEYGKIALWGLA